MTTVIKGHMKSGFPVTIEHEDRGSVPAIDETGEHFAAYTSFFKSDQFDDFYVQVDKKLADASPNPVGFRAAEDLAMLEAKGVDINSIKAQWGVE